MFSGERHDVCQHNYPESRSSTNASDVQESDDNFWVEQVSQTKSHSHVLFIFNKGINSSVTFSIQWSLSFGPAHLPWGGGGGGGYNLLSL